ncbi:MAG: adenosylmethionine decarboxylase [bacterium]
MTTHGKHLIFEFWGCDPQILASRCDLEMLALQAAEATGATVVGSLCQEFPGGGLSIALLLSESHLSFHSFPAESENQYCACDIFTCGDRCDPAKAIPILVAGFKAIDYSIVELDRGIAPGRPSKLVDYGPIGYLPDS